jgi:hypothetical protein
MKPKVHQHPSSCRESYFKNKTLKPGIGSCLCAHKTNHLSGWLHPHKICHRTEQFRSIEIPEMDSILHLCAWGSDVVSEVKLRRVNCWLRTISSPPAMLAWVSQNFCKVQHRLGPHNLKQKIVAVNGFNSSKFLHFRSCRVVWSKP